MVLIVQVTALQQWVFNQSGTGDKLTVSPESGSPGLFINTGGPILGELVVSDENLPSASTEPVKGFAYNKATGRIEENSKRML